EEILAGNIDIDRLRKPMAEERRPGESEADSRTRLSIPTPELPPRPGSPEDLARRREESVRPISPRELAGGREAVPTKRLPDGAEGPHRPIMVHQTVDIGARARAMRERIEANAKARREGAVERDKDRRRESEQ